MNKFNILVGLLITTIWISCSENKLEKGFSVSETEIETDDTLGITQDSLKLKTRPGSVLLTGIPQKRLTTVFRVNFNKRTETTFTGSNQSHGGYSDEETDNGNKWHYHYMPGIEAVYGYNMVNVSHYDIKTESRKDFFETPVLVKTLYYPAFSQDTLNFKPVQRMYYLISAYDEDTNKDGFINMKDLRRFYYFDINAENKSALIPKNYSVMTSEYDSANDFMYVYAKLDKDGNGRVEDGEEIHVFWIDLKDPRNATRQY